MKTRKGFTLLELLIVIGILAILSTTVVLVINPAELLRKARDAQRISDLNTMKTAIAYFMTEDSDPGSNMGTVNTSYSHLATTDCKAANATGDQTPTTAGWIPIPFNTMPGGSPIGSLPADPNPTDVDAVPGRYYVYLVNTSDITFQLIANMESDYYSKDGAGDVESTDGGSFDSLYEVGTDMDLLTATASSCFAGS